MGLSISFLVPALNEALVIEDTYRELICAVEEAEVSDFEILFVDDASVDETFVKMTAISKMDPRVRVYRNETNVGLGGSYKLGVRWATRDYYMLVPGDNAWPAKDIAGLLRCVGRADVIIPYLIEAGDKGVIRRFLSRGFTFFVNLLFGLDVKYFNGIVVHRLILLRQIQIETNSFAYQAEILVKMIKGGCSYFQLGLKTQPRVDGKSKALQVKNLLSVAYAMLKLRIKMLFFLSKAFQPLSKSLNE